MTASPGGWPGPTAAIYSAARGSSSVVEHYLAKVGVTGSSPASRSSLLDVRRSILSVAAGHAGVGEHPNRCCIWAVVWPR